MSIRTPRSVPAGFVGQLVRGALYPIEALGFINKNRLWPLTVVTILVNVVLLALLIAATIAYAVPYLREMDAAFTRWSGDSSIFGGLLGVLGFLLWVLAIAALVALNGLVLLLVGQAVASPFLDQLSEKVEALALGRSPAPFSTARMIRAIVVSISDLVWGLVVLTAVNLPLFVLSLTGIGAGPAAVVSFGFQALLFAHEFVGLSLTRDFVSYRGRWRVIWSNKASSLGFGSATMAIFAVPGLNLVLLPLATVGGTLLYCDLVSAGRITTDQASVPARRSA